MDCDRYPELMSAALDGECSAEERRELEGHLAVCPRCAALFRTLSAQSAALRELDCEPPAGLARHIMENLPEQEKAGRVIHWRRWGSLAACLLLVAAVGIAVPRSMRTGSAAPQTAEPGAALRAGDSLPSYGGPDPDSGSGEPAGDGISPGLAGFNLAPNAVSGQESGLCSLDNRQAIRVSYGAAPEAPSALVIGSTEELSDYLARFGSPAYDGEGNPLPMTELDALAETYTEEFFASRRLLCVVVEFGSGSIRCELDPQGLTRDSVTVRVTAPQVGTCDMAAWLLVAEVDAIFDGGDTLEVLFAP